MPNPISGVRRQTWEGTAFSKIAAVSGTFEPVGQGAALQAASPYQNTILTTSDCSMLIPCSSANVSICGMPSAMRLRSDELAIRIKSVNLWISQNVSSVNLYESLVSVNLLMNLLCVL